MTSDGTMAGALSAARCQRGATLLEALVAFLVLALGMLAAARVQTTLRLHADVSRQRAEATRLGQEEIERLRSFAVIDHTAGKRAYADIASGQAAARADEESHTRYVITRQVDTDAIARAKTASVTVAWTDPSGSAQQLVLNTIIAESDPAYSAVLGMAPSGTPVKGAFGRSVRVPLAAKDLGNGSSVWKPVATGTVAIVFDNRSGRVTGRCIGVSAAVATAELTTGALAGCDALVGQLLTGTVRFTSASPPDTVHANDAPLPFDISLALTGGSYAHAPQCSTESVTSGADRYAAYTCVVYPLASGQWSGRSSLAPSGWSLGTSSGDHRVCRFQADHDESGAIDLNVEHPAGYGAVDASLMNQNFLVIGGTETCPHAGPVDLTGSAGDIYADLTTVQHQP